jgi:uncharacterized repeat protein (TIGR01451 family)
MFEKLISNLPFSPSLVAQLGFYAQRLKREQWIRRLGLVFTVFALIIQSLAIFSPPESANAASANDMVPGGIHSVNQAVQLWDNNSYNFRDVMSYFGITRAELSSCRLDNSWTQKYASWPYSFGRTWQGFSGEQKWDIPQTGGGTVMMTSEPLSAWGGGNNWFVGLSCNSAHAGEFYIMKNCGNLSLKIPPTPPKPSAGCQSLDISVSGGPAEGVAGQTEYKIGPYGWRENGGTINDYYIEWSGPESGKTDWIKMADWWYHKFGKPGTYKITAYVRGSSGVVTDAACTKNLTVKEAPDLKYDLEKTGDKTTAQPGEVIKYTLTFYNTSNRELTDVVVKDKLPAGVTLEDEVATNPADGVSGDLFGDNGLKIAKVAAGKNVVITYSVKVAAKSNFQCGVSKLPNKASATTKELQTETNDANNEWTVDVKRDCNCSDPEIAKDNPECQSKKAAVNNTQGGANATTVKANGGDTITYTITVVNSHETEESTTIEDALTDTLEYADLTDQGGGTFNEETKTLSWQVTLQPGEVVTRTFTVTVKNPVPSKAQGQSYPLSYNCIMTNSYGTTIDIPVNCPPQKIIEQVVEQLPATGPGENIIFGGIVIAIVVFFYARSRQLGKEVRLVRREFDMGTLSQ